MDVYGLSSPELFRIDDLLDFPNDEVFPSSSSVAAATSSSASSSSFPPQNSFNHHHIPSASSFHPSSSFLTDFTHDLCVPSDDAAQLEWLSQFVDDSFSDFPAANNPLGGTITVRSDTSFPGKPRSKRSRAPTAASGTWTPMPEFDGQAPGKVKPKKEGGGRHQSAVAAAAEGEVRRCTHCASEKTPQWRTGPLGPKTLCNACGVRFKSGRLVPEYRPAASPTFMLTQHSNSHRKVMELRRQKELMRQQQLQVQQHHPPFQP